MAKKNRSRTPWILAAVIVFIAADLALVAFALRGPGNETGSVTALVPTTSSPAPSSAATTPPTGAATAPPTPGSTTSPTGGASALQGMASATVGFRSTAGSCTGTSTATDAVIELTTDGGKTWTTVNPTNIRIRAVEKVVVVDDRHVDLLAKYGADCVESAVSSYTQGEFWQVYPDRTDEFK